MSGPALWRWHGRAGRVAANNSSAAACAARLSASFHQVEIQHGLGQVV